jgi:hypothetical protein
METVRIKTTEFLQMQQNIQILEMQLNSIRNIFFRYVSSENEDLRVIVKQILQETTEPLIKAKFTPDITEGDKNVSPILLEGKWSNLDINAKQLRQQAWREY